MWPQLKDLIQGGFLETVVFDAVFPKPWPLHPMKSCLFLKYPIPTLSHPPCLKAIPHKLPLLTSVPLLPTQCLNLLSDHHLLVLWLTLPTTIILPSFSTLVLSHFSSAIWRPQSDSTAHLYNCCLENTLISPHPLLPGKTPMLLRTNCCLSVLQCWAAEHCGGTHHHTEGSPF